MRWEDIRQEWFADPEFAAAFDRDYPYHESRWRSVDYALTSR